MSWSVNFLNVVGNIKLIINKTFVSLKLNSVTLQNIVPYVMIMTREKTKKTALSAI